MSGVDAVTEMDLRQPDYCIAPTVARRGRIYSTMSRPHSIMCRINVMQSAFSSTALFPAVVYNYNFITYLQVSISGICLLLFD